MRRLIIQKLETGNFSRRNFLTQNIYIFSAVIVVGAFYIINPSFLSLYSIQSITREMAPMLPMACGMGQQADAI